VKNKLFESVKTAQTYAPTQHTASEDCMKVIKELRRMREGNGLGLIKVPIPGLEGLKETTNNQSQDSWYPGRDYTLKMEAVCPSEMSLGVMKWTSNERHLDLTITLQ
jgi:hypothetical protein